MRAVAAAMLSAPVVFAFWLVVLPSVLSGAFDVLIPLRLDDLGASGVAVGAAFFIAAAIEAFTAPAIGRVSDRRGRHDPDPRRADRLPDRGADPAAAGERGPAGRRAGRSSCSR